VLRNGVYVLLSDLIRKLQIQLNPGMRVVVLGDGATYFSFKTTVTKAKIGYHFLTLSILIGGEEPKQLKEDMKDLILDMQTLNAQHQLDFVLSGDMKFLFSCLGTSVGVDKCCLYCRSSKADYDQESKIDDTRLQDFENDMVFPFIRQSNSFPTYTLLFLSEFALVSDVLHLFLRLDFDFICNATHKKQYF
jgi:hypothetical protein